FFGAGAGNPQPLHAIEIAVHRVVHCGTLSCKSTLLTPDVKAEIRAAIPLAPEHNPTTLAGIAAVEQHFGAIEQVAIFDSAFHATLPPAAFTYATPLRWREVWGMRRLGFHGISHQYCAQRSAQLMQADFSALKIVSCHLGNGSSLAAIAGGRSVDTTMGWTPLEGVVMGDRSGSVDPGILLYLLDSGRMSASELRRVLNEESGLLGISGLSRDMRDIVEAVASGHPRAKLAFDVYSHRLRAAIGAMIASLGGLDALLFTGGVGENVAQVRAAACEGLEVFGLHLDREANKFATPDANVAESGQRIPICVIRSEERWAMARECYHLLNETLKV
ncbi:MAG TPA: acetate/propionate family kinase, partial [Candidatus Eremiobacteraceae bacterium]|nr:acetate/propionate family kinase [Candidatus Eremiobacteraceae bacterium]